MPEQPIYQGNFNLPPKANPNNKWIYIVGSAVARLPAPGTRVNPVTDAAKMPKIVIPNGTDTIELLSRANHWRFVGIEFYLASNEGCNPKATPPVNCYTTGGLIRLQPVPATTSFQFRAGLIPVTEWSPWLRDTFLHNPPIRGAYMPSSRADLFCQGRNAEPNP